MQKQKPNMRKIKEEEEDPFNPNNIDYKCRILFSTYRVGAEDGWGYPIPD